MRKIKIPANPKSDSYEIRTFIFSLLIKCLIFGISLLFIWKFSNTYAVYIIFSLSFLLIAGVSLLFYFLKKDKHKEIKPIIENITTDFIYGLELPVIITNDSGNIVWYNDAFSEFFPIDKHIFNSNISEILNHQIAYDMIRNKDKNFSSEFVFEERNFIVSRYHISSNNSELDIFMFKDRTEITGLKNELDMKDSVIAYIVVDNMLEIAQTMQDKYRSASGAVSGLLKKWISKNHGVIKEYEKDKYVCFFENESLKVFEKDKFSILDEIRDIKIEDMGIPVTISAGVSGVKGTISEKDLIAQQALDLALQRGGDQVVVKRGPDSMQFYGGKTKTVQKKTKIRSRVVATQLKDLMKNSSNVLIMGHRFADNDSIGASVGIARFARSIGVTPNIIVNIHDKNLQSSFTKLKGLHDYEDIFVDSVKANDLITSTTSLIVVDVNNSKHFEAEEIYKIVPRVAIIDHHRKTTEFIIEPVISYIEPSASSASELIAEILEQSLSPGELLKEEAELLLAGIILDTKQFAKNTGTRTFSAALYLRGEGGNPSDALSIFTTELDEFVREAKFESNVMIYRNCIAMAVLPTEVTTTDNSGAKAADKMLNIAGVNASFAIYKANDTIYISARSLGTINVQLILEAFGGGGHYDGAGAQVKNSSLKDVLSALQKKIDEYFNGEQNNLSKTVKI